MMTALPLPCSPRKEPTIDNVHYQRLGILKLIANRNTCAQIDLRHAKQVANDHLGDTVLPVDFFQAYLSEETHFEMLLDNCAKPQVQSIIETTFQTPFTAECIRLALSDITIFRNRIMVRAAKSIGILDKAYRQVNLAIFGRRVMFFKQLFQ